MESAFHADLASRGFKLTGEREGVMRGCMYNGHAYTLPIPLYIAKPGAKDETAYCPFSIQRFYKHVDDAEAAADLDDHGHSDFSITDTPKES